MRPSWRFCVKWFGAAVNELFSGTLESSKRLWKIALQRKIVDVSLIMRESVKIVPKVHTLMSVGDYNLDSAMHVISMSLLHDVGVVHRCLDFLCLRLRRERSR